ncbi:hypothetical protein NAF17_05135 [Mucilaginibacter sp. RB4R14]|uniref:hypothetical protein n=1 Tax=Mucilaginibacter aurantiaciroseus TaxID=2949308 RepID=UPI002090CE8C|nr:hypothetical protein [Mucilaginibacter aurantiaciroseus]MCO5934915.1 hypothetical protein [Mucilaginibacter aurantiaciroseus]
MPGLPRILFTMLLMLPFAIANAQGQEVRVDFYKDPFTIKVDRSVLVNMQQQLSADVIKKNYNTVNTGNYQPIIDSLLAYKQKHQLNDWLYYQLVRRVAQQISPKETNYGAYTFYKWFMLNKSGYDARLALSHQKVIFYVYNNEDISDIPYFMVDGKQFVCLNYHDYAKADLNDDPPIPVNIPVAAANKAFSYKVTMMPDFKPEHDVEKQMSFEYDRKQYHFKIKLNTDQQKAFNNYPGVSFETYFNIPLSKETYGSLVPLLKKNMKGMDEHKGVDYLMRFTRYAFLYENDNENFGREKRLSPAETLASNYSDCDDRAALFFYLVKEIYNLPMIALLYPTHITMAVEFNKPIGDPIVYKGKTYSVCEPTPQLENLAIGQLSAKLKSTPYHVVYAYEPLGK